MLDILLDALKDSALIFIWLFVVNFAFSFIEEAVSEKKLKGRGAIPLASGLGLLPQCGFSVIASEKYANRKITAGTLLAVFIATSDEALPVFLASGAKFYLIFPLLALKFVIAVLAGYLFDAIFKKANLPLVSKENSHANAHTNENERASESHARSHCGCGCCHEEHEEKNQKLHAHLLHPLKHSLKTFAVVLVLNLFFGLLVYLVTEERLTAFLNANALLSPLFAAIIGLIPNCAASVIISNLYLSGGIPFGACLSGLIANAGLGLTILIKNEKSIKNKITIAVYLVATAVITGYITCLIVGF